jgi:hypothetical protein
MQSKKLLLVKCVNSVLQTKHNSLYIKSTYPSGVSAFLHLVTDKYNINVLTLRLQYLTSQESNRIVDLT